MGKVTITVTESNVNVPVADALISVTDANNASILSGVTDQNGVLEVELADGGYYITIQAFEQIFPPTSTVTVVGNTQAPISIDLGAFCEACAETTTTPPIEYCTQGDVVTLIGDVFVIGQYKGIGRTPPVRTVRIKQVSYEWMLSAGALLELDPKPNVSTVNWDTNGIVGIQFATVKITNTTPSGDGASIVLLVRINVRASTVLQRTDSLPISMRRAAPEPTLDQFLWPAIRNRTRAIRFGSYTEFINKVLCGKDIGAVKDTATNPPMKAAIQRQMDELYSPVHGVGSFDLLKTATQIFLLLECGVKLEEKDRYAEERLLYEPGSEASRLGRPVSYKDAEQQLHNYLGGGNLPYIERVLETAFKGYAAVDSVFCNGRLSGPAGCPVLLELIWSYWHEEAMLVQSMNAISLRFQNRRSGVGRDPLAHLEIAPLYPINNLIFGYIQDELFRTSVKRRAYEYDHHYGISPIGRAVGTVQPADSRSQFLEAFHNLLYRAILFYKQSDDTTMIADGFPVLNALREVHLLLAQGAHNQYGDLPWMARAEMLMQQWIFSRPEMREFLQTRAMVPYKESWMPPVDTMKTMQGWTDVSVTHFHDLAEYGEQVLLSIRLGDWVAVNDPLSAANWATYWRPEIQGYLHAYRVATGVDLTLEPREELQAKLWATQPSVLLQQRRRAEPAVRMAAGQTPAGMSLRERKAARTQQ